MGQAKPERHTLVTARGDQWPQTSEVDEQKQSPIPSEITQLSGPGKTAPQLLAVTRPSLGTALLGGAERGTREPHCRVSGASLVQEGSDAAPPSRFCPWSVAFAQPLLTTQACQSGHVFAPFVPKSVSLSYFTIGHDFSPSPLQTCLLTRAGSTASSMESADTLTGALPGASPTRGEPRTATGSPSCPDCAVNRRASSRKSREMSSWCRKGLGHCAGVVAGNSFGGRGESREREPELERCT